MRTLVVLIAVIAVLISGTAVAATPTAQPGAVAVIVAGQSNSCGRGEILPEDLIPEPGVWVVKRDGRILPGSDPFNFPSPPRTGYGRTLARTLINAGVAPEVWIIQCGVSSTSINRWIGSEAPSHGPFPGIKSTSLQARAGSILYMGCLAQAAIARHHGVKDFLAVAWHQGESGCNSPYYSSHHAELLQVLKRQFQTNFPGILFIGGEMARSFPCTYRQVVVDAVQAVSDGFADSEGLFATDGTHFNRASQRELGVRFANEILRLLGL